MPSIDYYWPEVARGAEDEAKKYGLRVMLRGSSYETTDEQPQLARLVQQPGVRGLVIAPSMNAPTAASTVTWLAALPVPVVLVERAAVVEPHHAVMESVVSDHALGAAPAVRHLTSLGHRRVGVVLGRESPTSPHVRRGWLEAAHECGFDPDSTVDVDLPDARSGQWDGALDATLDACLSSGTTALLVHADAEAMAIVQRLEERGVSVPEKLSVVAYDDEVAGLFTPPLTAVRPPRSSVGRAAVGLVAARLADPDRPTHRVIISPTLPVRGSTCAATRVEPCLKGWREYPFGRLDRVTVSDNIASNIDQDDADCGQSALGPGSVSAHGRRRQYTTNRYPLPFTRLTFRRPAACRLTSNQGFSRPTLTTVVPWRCCCRPEWPA